MGRSEVATVAFEDVDQRVAKVAQQMPAIGDLLSLRRALARTFGAGAGPIAGDHLDARVGREPGGYGLGLPVGQERDGTATLQIDDERAVGGSSPPSPVVEADDPRLAGLREGHGAHRAQQRVGADRHGETRREPGAWRAADGEAEAAVHLGQSLGSAQARRRRMPWVVRMITAVELDLAAAHLEAFGIVTDAVAPSLAVPALHRRFLEGLERRHGERTRLLTDADLSGHGRVWAILDPPARSRGGAVLAIRESVEEGAWELVGRRAGA